MSEELLIDVSAFESRVALVQDGAVSAHLARSVGYSVTGNIYLGKVVRVVPGMQAAFVEIGLERPGFLHLSDIETPLMGPNQTSNNPWEFATSCMTDKVMVIVSDPSAVRGKAVYSAC